MRSKTTCAVLLATAATLVAAPANAGEVDALLDKLVEKGQLSAAEAQEVRNEIGGQAKQREDEQKALVKEASKDLIPKWTQSIAWSGDMRLRHEAFWREDSPDRNRERIRFRAGLKAKVSDAIEAGSRLATATPLDPISTNQTLGRIFEKKPLFLDQAYVKYSTASLPAPPRVPITAIAGKFDIPFATTSLVWDGDVTMEGIAATLSPAAGGFEGALAGGAFPLEELGADEDPALLAGQAGLAWSPAGGSWRPSLKTLKLRATVSYYDFVNLDAGLPTSRGASLGNTATTNADKSVSYLARDFDELDVLVEVASTLLGRPVKVAGDYVRNTAPGDRDEGYQVGARWGRADPPFAFEIGAFYQRLEADAVVGRFTDSDFGDGGTGAAGTVAWATLGTLRNSTLGVRWASVEPIAGGGGRLDRVVFDWMTRF